MKTRRRQYWVLLLVLLVVIAMTFLASIPMISPDLPSLDPKTPSWKTYANSQLNYSIELPEPYYMETGGESNDVVFRLEGSPLVVMSCLTKAEADSRGLWADHEPVADIELGGRAGKKYVYNHFDIVFGVHTISYVVPHSDKFFALEFRMRKASILEELGLTGQPRELGEIEKRILDSFVWLDEKPPVQLENPKN